MRSAWSVEPCRLFSSHNWTAIKYPRQPCFWICRMDRLLNFVDQVPCRDWSRWPFADSMLFGRKFWMFLVVTFGIDFKWVASAALTSVLSAGLPNILEVNATRWATDRAVLRREKMDALATEAVLGTTLVALTGGTLGWAIGSMYIRLESRLPLSTTSPAVLVMSTLVESNVALRPLSHKTPIG